MNNEAFLKDLHDTLYKEIERLIDLDPAKDSEEGVVLTALAEILSDVESRHFFKKEKRDVQKEETKEAPTASV